MNCLLKPVVFFVLSGMAAVHPPIARDATIPLILEKKVENGIETENGNIGTRRGIARTPILIGIRGRGSAFKPVTLCEKNLPNLLFKENPKKNPKLQVLIFLISFRDRSSHTREREHSPSQEKWREDKADHRDWEDREKSPSMDQARGRDRERSLSYERDRRSSSDERESGEI